MTSVAETTLQEADSTLFMPVIPGMEDQLAIAHSGRDFGNMDPRFGTPESVLANRQRLYRAVRLGVSQVAVMQPCNDAKTFVDLGGQRVFGPDILTDAFVTPLEEVGLAMNLADCNAIALTDGQTLGMIHAGWRGAVQGFQNRVIEHMVSEYGFDPEHAVAYFAPAIGPRSYVMDALHPKQQTDTWEPYIQPVGAPAGEQYHIDLPGYLSHELQAEWGIPEDHVLPSGIDVGADDTHFSYTRFKEDPLRSPNGRNGFVAVRYE